MVKGLSTSMLVNNVFKWFPKAWENRRLLRLIIFLHNVIICVLETSLPINLTQNHGDVEIGIVSKYLEARRERFEQGRQAEAAGSPASQPASQRVCVAKCELHSNSHLLPQGETCKTKSSDTENKV